MLMKMIVVLIIWFIMGLIMGLIIGLPGAKDCQGKRRRIGKALPTCWFKHLQQIKSKVIEIDENHDISEKAHLIRMKLVGSCTIDVIPAVLTDRIFSADPFTPSFDTTAIETIEILPKVH